MNAPRVVDELPSIRFPAPVRESSRRRLRALGIRLGRPLYGLHAGGLYGRAKHWGDDRYGELADRLRADGNDVVLLTSPSERAQAEYISANCNGLPMIGHEGDVLHLAAAISQCSVVVTNDSGPLHLAAALAVPTVSIFGPTDPGRTVIPGAGRIIRNNTLGCQPCYQRECPLRHHRCMSEVTVDEVYGSAVGLVHEMDDAVEVRTRSYNRSDVRNARRRQALQDR
jgi:ADP-heptose:LPS heptosyltransferase